MTTLATQACPECEAAVAVPDAVERHEILECPECRVELEVLTTDPVRIAVAPEPEEDWGE